jgi:hypothetical protein
VGTEVHRLQELQHSVYLTYRERQRRLEVLHQERIVAMEKGIPLPELPLERLKPTPDPSAIITAAVSLGLSSYARALAYRSDTVTR